MADPIEKILPRFRYGVIHPRANEEFQRGPAYQLYRLVPLDVMEISTGLGLENYTPDGVEKAVGNYWKCVEVLAKEKADLIIFSGAPISGVLGRPRVVELLRQTKEKTGIPADAPLEALIAAMNHLGLKTLTIGSRWADAVNEAMTRYLEAGGIKVVGITKRNQWAADAFAMSLEEGLEDRARGWTGGGKAGARSRCHCSAWGSSHGSPRHPGFGRGIRQAGIHEYEC